MAFIEWWNSLELASQVFYCIAIPATLILLIQTVLMFFGFENDADGDLDMDLPDTDMDVDLSDADIDGGIFGEDAITETPDLAGLESLHIFTVRGIIAFLVIFGWVGVVLQEAGLNLFITLPIAAICGFAMMFIIAYLFRSVMKLRSNGTADNRNAVGAAGKVHLTIPPSRTGEGKVHVMLQGAYVERNAVTDETEAIPTGCEIIVVGVSGQTSLVVKRK
ncbi:MAG: NfeD family protein [Clostridia bacterium]|nr:NfeD family protein [Clostridia bacterium]